MDTSKGEENKRANFKVGLHEPSYDVMNLRHSDAVFQIGVTVHGDEVKNEANFPKNHSIDVEMGESVYEIPNPFPFWGTTYILKWKADEFKKNPKQFRFKRKYEDMTHEDREILFETLIGDGIETRDGKKFTFRHLPRHILLTLAQNSKNPRILTEIARISCEIRLGQDNTPLGLYFEDRVQKAPVPIIHDKPLFEVVANNPCLPDDYKQVMVLNPGVQGQNPIVGEYRTANTHVWEYLRKNSYIPWGHYASNMAQDAIRYSVDALSPDDIKGLRFLYYQRIYVELARSLGLTPVEPNGDDEKLEGLRLYVLDCVKEHVEMKRELKVTGNLWGWNYGFGYASSGYRLHASHQQIHNQYALVPAKTSCGMTTYTVGDLVWNHVERCSDFRPEDFFDAYIHSILDNKRTDGTSDAPQELVIFEDENVIAYCPKAQRYQGEVHLMVKKRIGNILEADSGTRHSLDHGILKVMKALSALGAEMITVFEVSKKYHRISAGQRLFYCFLPRHEDSPGSMSEAQGRWITGHYPEDFAWLLREMLAELEI